MEARRNDSTPVKKKQGCSRSRGRDTDTVCERILNSEQLQSLKKLVCQELSAGDFLGRSVGNLLKQACNEEFVTQARKLIGSLAKENHHFTQAQLTVALAAEGAYEIAQLLQNSLSLRQYFPKLELRLKHCADSDVEHCLRMIRETQPRLWIGCCGCVTITYGSASLSAEAVARVDALLDKYFESHPVNQSRTSLNSSYLQNARTALVKETRSALTQMVDTTSPSSLHAAVPLSARRRKRQRLSEAISEKIQIPSPEIEKSFLLRESHEDVTDDELLSSSGSTEVYLNESPVLPSRRAEPRGETSSASIAGVSLETAVVTSLRSMCLDLAVAQNTSSSLWFSDIFAYFDNEANSTHDDRVINFLRSVTNTNRSAALLLCSPSVGKLERVRQALQCDLHESSLVNLAAVRKPSSSGNAAPTDVMHIWLVEFPHSGEYEFTWSFSRFFNCSAGYEPKAGGKPLSLNYLCSSISPAVWSLLFAGVVRKTSLTSSTHPHRIAAIVGWPESSNLLYGIMTAVSATRTVAPVIRVVTEQPADALASNLSECIRHSASSQLLHAIVRDQNLFGDAVTRQLLSEN